MWWKVVKIISEPCTTCHGTGKERKNRKIKVNIPAELTMEMLCHFRGQGEQGANGGPPGDLYINIKVAPHKIFKRNGLIFI